MRSVISPASKWWIANHHPELVVKSKLGCCSNWPIQIHIDIDLIPRSLDLDSDETRASSTSTVRIAYFRIPPTRACRFASMRSIMMPTTGPTYAARSARRAPLETHDDISSLVSNILRFSPRHLVSVCEIHVLLFRVMFFFRLLTKIKDPKLAPHTSVAIVRGCSRYANDSAQTIVSTERQVHRAQWLKVAPLVVRV